MIWTGPAPQDSANPCQAGSIVAPDSATERLLTIMDKISGLGFGLFALLLAAPASAHLDLLDPPARLKGQDGNTQLKTKPCGQTTNKRTTDKVTAYAPGQKVDIKIKEYINHPGYFAVAFDPEGDDSFVFPRPNADKVVSASDDPKTLFPVDGAQVLGLRTDKDKDCYGENAAHECTISITIPSTPCQSCTLQVTQFMYDKLGNNVDDEYYYQCADIKIEGAASGGTGGGGGSGGAATAGSAGAATAGSTVGGSASGGAGAGSSGAASGGVPVTPVAGSTSAGSPTSSGGIPGGGGGTTTPPANAASPDEGGCGVAHRSAGAATALSVLALALALGRRRARAV
jgi:hypothetical protein